MDDYNKALAAARVAYNRLLREDRTAQACQLAEDALLALLAAIDAQEAAVAAAMRETRDESSRVAVTVPVRRADLAALAAADFGRSGWSAELEQVAVRLRAALAERGQEIAP